MKELNIGTEKIYIDHDKCPYMRSGYELEDFLSFFPADNQVQNIDEATIIIRLKWQYFCKKVYEGDTSAYEVNCYLEVVDSLENNLDSDDNIMIKAHFTGNGNFSDTRYYKGNEKITKIIFGAFDKSELYLSFIDLMHEFNIIQASSYPPEELKDLEEYELQDILLDIGEYVNRPESRFKNVKYKAKNNIDMIKQLIKDRASLEQQYPFLLSHPTIDKKSNIKKGCLINILIFVIVIVSAIVITSLVESTIVNIICLSSVFVIPIVSVMVSVIRYNKRSVISYTDKQRFITEFEENIIQNPHQMKYGDKHKNVQIRVLSKNDDVIIISAFRERVIQLFLYDYYLVIEYNQAAVYGDQIKELIEGLPCVTFNKELSTYVKALDEIKTDLNKADFIESNEMKNVIKLLFPEVAFSIETNKIIVGDWGNEISLKYFLLGCIQLKPLTNYTNNKDFCFLYTVVCTFEKALAQNKIDNLLSDEHVCYIENKIYNIEDHIHRNVKYDN